MSRDETEKEQNQYEATLKLPTKCTGDSLPLALPGSAAERDCSLPG